MTNFVKLFSKILQNCLHVEFENWRTREKIKKKSKKLDIRCLAIQITLDKITLYRPFNKAKKICY